jgi:hypothetical protein
MKKPVMLGLALATLLGTAAVAGTQDSWLHVRVQESDEDGDRVNVNIPLQLVEAILPTIETDELHQGRLKLDSDDLEGIDLREILKAFRETPDADFVVVEGKDDSVRVAKENGFLVVRVEEKEGDNVRVTMPLEVVDAMLGDDGEELDLIAALRALSEFDGGDLVTVESDDSNVRVWIDTSKSGD